MSSSLNQPTSEPGIASGSGSGFGFPWKSAKAIGPETVITSARILPLPTAPADANGSGPEFIPRLFPGAHGVDNVTGISIGHFTIQKRIGAGGMGSVFLAQTIV